MYWKTAVWCAPDGLVNCDSLHGSWTKNVIEDYVWVNGKCHNPPYLEIISAFLSYKICKSSVLRLVYSIRLRS